LEFDFQDIPAELRVISSSQALKDMDKISFSCALSDVSVMQAT
jgi:hypothetical protein